MNLQLYDKCYFLFYLNILQIIQHGNQHQAACVPVQTYRPPPKRNGWEQYTQGETIFVRYLFRLHSLNKYYMDDFHHLHTYIECWI